MKETLRKRYRRPIEQLDTYPRMYFIIVTDTEKTEKYYFEGLKHSMQANQKNKKNKVSIKVHSDIETQQLVSQARLFKEKSSQFNPNVWIVFDRDQVPNFDKIIQTAENEGISVAWSNPCFEVWFLAYFENIPLDIGNSQMCQNEFKRVFKKETGLDYQKDDEKIYDYLKKYGDEDEAFKRAKNVRESYEKMAPSRMFPSTKVDLLVKKILKKEETQSAVDVSS